MILNWTTSEPVVSRIIRNIKGVDAVYMDDILEWIPEAVGKMKTVYNYEYRHYDIPVNNHQAILPCRIEGLVGITYNGFRLNYKTGGRKHHHHPSSAGFSLFQSITPIYTSSGDLSQGDVGRSPFPRDVITMVNMEWDPEGWYQMNGKFITTSICDGTIKVYTQQIPRDENGYPLIPESELYEEAVYRYCRMMLIEAGHEDRVFSHDKAVAAWENAANRAITDISFPIPDQVESSIHRHLDDYFPDSYYF